jgi:hypothetical protein
MGFHGDSMGVQGDDSGFDDDLMGNIMGISFQYKWKLWDLNDLYTFWWLNNWLLNMADENK